MTAPTVDELRKRYTSAVKKLKAEKQMREWVFRDEPETKAAKVAEIDEVLATLLWMKDALKEHCEPVYEQPALLDVPVEPSKERRAEFS